MDQEISLLCFVGVCQLKRAIDHWFSSFVSKGLIRFSNKIFLFRNERPTHCVGGGGALGRGKFHLVCCFPTSNIFYLITVRLKLFSSRIKVKKFLTRRKFLWLCFKTKVRRIKVCGVRKRYRWYKNCLKSVCPPHDIWQIH